jgi:hypothetical protein
MSGLKRESLCGVHERFKVPVRTISGVDFWGAGAWSQLRLTRLGSAWCGPPGPNRPAVGPLLGALKLPSRLCRIGRSRLSDGPAVVDQSGVTLLAK